MKTRHAVIKRSFAVIAATVLIVCASMLGVTTSALALPSNYTGWVGTNNIGYAKCTKGTGSFRAGIACRWVWGSGFTAWGYKKPIGHVSQVSCPVGSFKMEPQWRGIRLHPEVLLSHHTAYTLPCGDAKQSVR